MSPRLHEKDKRVPFGTCSRILGATRFLLTREPVHLSKGWTRGPLAESPTSTCVAGQ